MNRIRELCTTIKPLVSVDHEYNSVSAAGVLRISSPFLEENSLLYNTVKPRVDLFMIILNTSDNIVGRNQIFWEVSVIMSRS